MNDINSMANVFPSYHLARAGRSSMKIGYRLSGAGVGWAYLTYSLDEINNGIERSQDEEFKYILEQAKDFLLKSE